MHMLLQIFQGNFRFFHARHSKIRHRAFKTESTRRERALLINVESP
jgi:hypothetical protein